jgi:hypothetical protein
MSQRGSNLRLSQLHPLRPSHADQWESSNITRLNHVDQSQRSKLSHQTDRQTGIRLVGEDVLSAIERPHKNVMHVNAHIAPTDQISIPYIFKIILQYWFVKLVGVSFSIISLPVSLYMSVSICQKANLHTKVKNYFA